MAVQNANTLTAPARAIATWIWKSGPGVPIRDWSWDGPHASDPPQEFASSDHPDLWRLNGLAVSCRLSRKRGGDLVRKIEEFPARHFRRI